MTERVDNELKDISGHNIISLTNSFPTKCFRKAEFLTLFTQNQPENRNHSMGEGNNQQSKGISKHFMFNQIESRGNCMQSLLWKC